MIRFSIIFSPHTKVWGFYSVMTKQQKTDKHYFYDAVCNARRTLSALLIAHKEDLIDVEYKQLLEAFTIVHALEIKNNPYVQ